ncbi:ALVEOLIN1, related [Neospora caninum Liverpool]|uniref:ALVEOLIN1, related n=1 Tax=Neospora caninum (strain Liverpool) TaxID=572307 RepID=F0VGL7_NEOCL|nr:ALVEOLIN1, related [Neospora caninum Liverpool]CBZ52861.1 ALVEOLIN1, related [Neospora caninum Liverpool]|eukprot:XP_003882893.1 ALVEOLIN1, related [Neospora caninum Liverpool]
MEFLENICCEPRERLPAIPVLPLTSVAGLPASQTLIEENVTYTTKPMVAEQIIEVPQVEYRDHIVEERQTVVMEKVVHVPRNEIKERVVEIPRHITREVFVDVPQVQVVEKFVEVPTPVYQEKIIPVARPVIKQKTTHVPKPVIHEKTVEVPRVYYKPVTVEKIVEVPDYRIEYKYRDVPVPQKVFRIVPVDRIKYVPQIRYVEKVVKKPEIRTHTLPLFENVHERPVAVAAPRRVPVASPATPVLVERQRREANQLVYLPSPTPVAERLVSSVQHSSVERPQSVPSAAASPRSLPTTVSQSPLPPSEPVIETKLGTMTFPEERRMQLLELQEQQRLVQLQAHQQQTANEAQHQLFMKEQEHLRREAQAVADDVMIQTRYGPMKFQNFEKLNNEDAMTSPLVSGPVAGVYPVVYESHDEDLLDQRYKMQLQQLTKIAARNAFQAGRNVYEGVRNLVNGGKQG